ncbi:hypothetical protein [Rhodococcus artemisiae]|uniref:Uncharacterized protein n=1 Tax=Rhodococcus artemisiae TaxID=714159 RepID=A0ABU7LK12_9NOCA|nr:hypothetical protein [Rhodococcus artemisiae]MEE2061841.1 hypothetical protein [Rhodococcus artemisiae]
MPDNTRNGPRRSLRERLEPFGEDVVRETVAQHIRAACAMAGDFGGEDPRAIIDRLEAGAAIEDLLDELRPKAREDILAAYRRPRRRADGYRTERKD